MLWHVNTEEALERLVINLLNGAEFDTGTFSGCRKGCGRDGANRRLKRLSRNLRQQQRVQVPFVREPDLETIGEIDLLKSLDLDKTGRHILEPVLTGRNGA